MKNTPLKVDIVNGQLIISIGVDTLAFADTARTGIKINNPEGFAKDVVYAITSEDEIGASMLTNTLDEAMQKAAEDGSIYVDF